MIRFFVRWAFRGLILGIVLAVALALLKDTLGKAYLESRIRSETGMDVRIGVLELGLFNPTLSIRDAQVFNLAEFGGSPFLKIPDLHMEYYPGALLRRALRFKLVRLAVTEINVVEARSGRTNLILALPDSGPANPSLPETYGGFRFLGIETLNLTLGKVNFRSLRQAGKSTEVTLGLNNEILTDLKSLDQIREVIVKSLFRKGITIVTEPSRPPRTPARQAAGGRR